MVTVHEILNPIGVDASIKQAQISLKKRLKWDNVEIFGRVFKKRSDSVILPQAYINNGEYNKSVLTNEKSNSRIFFIVGDEQKSLGGGLFSTDIKTVVITDLSFTYSDKVHVADLDAQNHINSILVKNSLFKNITKIETDYKKILRDYEYSLAEKFSVHPFTIFAFVSDVRYRINTNCN